MGISHQLLFLEFIICLFSQNWTKIKQPVSQSVQWPAGRYGHTASRITDSVFVMIGGSDESDEYALSGSDVWLCDSSQWKEVLSSIDISFHTYI